MTLVLSLPLLTDMTHNSNGCFLVQEIQTLAVWVFESTTQAAIFPDRSLKAVHFHFVRATKSIMSRGNIDFVFYFTVPAGFHSLFLRLLHLKMADFMAAFFFFNCHAHCSVLLEQLKIEK